MVNVQIVFKMVNNIDYKLSKMGNNMLFNKIYGANKPFSFVKMWVISKYEEMLNCQDCNLDYDEIDNRLNELVNEN
jgi:hypothetical protein